MPKMHQNSLAARLCPDPVGSISAPQTTLAAIEGGGYF